MGVKVSLNRKEVFFLRSVMSDKVQTLKGKRGGKVERHKAVSLLRKLSDMLAGKPPHVSKAQSVSRNQSTRSKRSSASHGGSHRVNGSTSGSSSGNSSGDPDPDRPRVTPRLLATRLDAFKEVLA